MWSPKQQVLKLARSLRRGRSIELPKDNAHAARVLVELIVSNQHGTMTDLLSDSSFDVNYAIGRVQKTLLHIAANCGHYECLNVLLKKGCNPNIPDISGSVALHLAARNGQKRCVEKLLDSGANPDVAGNDGATTIHWLAVNGRDEILRTVLFYTSRVNLEDGQGHTALHAAARNGHVKAMECLIEAGADVNYSNSSGTTPLHSACTNGQRHAISLLLAKGALLEADNEGKTPFYLCLMGGYGVASEILLQHSSKNVKEFVSKAIYQQDINFTKVVECLKYFSTRPLGKSLAVLIATELSDIGFRLLSPTSDEDKLLCNLMHACSLLVTLGSTTSIANASEIDNIFNTLEQLWKSVEDWLLLLREEVQQGGENDIVCEQSENADDIHEDGGDNEVRGLKENYSQGQTENMLLKMASRISALINVFYQCITCQDGLMPQRFTDFVKRHIDVLKRIVHHNPKIIFEHFSFLFDNSDLMSLFLCVIKQQPFVERYKWFYEHLRKVEKNEFSNNVDTSSLQVHRHTVFEESCSQIESLSTASLRRHLAVQFVDEEGVGDGVLREWFSLLSNEILNPQYCLFTQSSDGCTFQPCSNSAINPDHLSYFKFAGRILGLALYHRQLVNVSFTLSFYKHLLGRKVNYTDVASIDPEYAKNLQWILDNDVTDLGLELTFAVETDVFGAMEEIELKPKGSNISVTEENKEEYVQLVTELRMTRAIQPQIDAFMEGFSHFIPRSLIQIFSEHELDLLLSGSKEINIEDWKKITNYGGNYGIEHQVIVWFWECVTKMSDADRSLLICFVTGRSRLPHVVLAQESLKFMISEVHGSNEDLPTASTCMNMLKLPKYASYEVLEDKLLIAVRMGSYGYAFT